MAEGAGIVARAPSPLKATTEQRMSSVEKSTASVDNSVHKPGKSGLTTRPGSLPGTAMTF